MKYEYYIDRLEAIKSYKRIASSILKENVEKIFLIYNEKFININKQLKGINMLL